MGLRQLLMEGVTAASFFASLVAIFQRFLNEPHLRGGSLNAHLRLHKTTIKHHKSNYPSHPS